MDDPERNISPVWFPPVGVHQSVIVGVSDAGDHSRIMTSLRDIGPKAELWDLGGEAAPCWGNTHTSASALCIKDIVAGQSRSQNEQETATIQSKQDSSQNYAIELTDLMKTTVCGRNCKRERNQRKGNILGFHHPHNLKTILKILHVTTPCRWKAERSRETGWFLCQPHWFVVRWSNIIGSIMVLTVYEIGEGCCAPATLPCRE